MPVPIPNLTNQTSSSASSGIHSTGDHFIFNPPVKGIKTETVVISAVAIAFGLMLFFKGR